MEHRFSYHIRTSHSLTLLTHVTFSKNLDVDKVYKAIIVAISDWIGLFTI